MISTNQLTLLANRIRTVNRKVIDPVIVPVIHRVVLRVILKQMIRKADIYNIIYVQE